MANNNIKLKYCFISFEGPDGVGKTTQSKLLRQYLIEQGYKVNLTREPGGTVGAEEIRQLLLNGPTDKWHYHTELLLHMAARNEHIDKFIKPNLAQGNIVISDRFVHSTLVYQGYGLGVDKQLIVDLHNRLFANFWPCLTIILHDTDNQAASRVQKRGEELTRYEKMHIDFQQRVLQGFTELPRMALNNTVIIDVTNCAIEQTQQKIIDLLQ